MPIVPASGSRASFCSRFSQLAFGAPPRQHAVLERGDAGRIIAAVFEALERVDKERRDRFAADDPDNAAHRSGSSPCRRRGLLWLTVKPQC